MGFDAYVPCRCVSDSSVAPPTEFAIKVTECGDVEYEYDWSDDGVRRRFDAWRETICPHEDFEIATCRLSNVGGMGSLRHAVFEAGNLPILQTRLPTVNGGCVPADEVPAALKELDLLHSLSSSGPLHRMIDTDSGQVLREETASEDGIFSVYTDHGIEMGLDGGGFYILQVDLTSDQHIGTATDAGRQVDRDGSEVQEPRLVEVFRARRVRQLTDGPIVGRDQPVILQDRDSGMSFRSPCALRDWGSDVAMRWSRSEGETYVERIPEHFRVETVARPDDWFDYILIPLRSMLEVALDHRSSVVWT